MKVEEKPLGFAECKSVSQCALQEGVSEVGKWFVAMEELKRGSGFSVISILVLFEPKNRYYYGGHILIFTVHSQLKVWARHGNLMVFHC